MLLSDLQNNGPEGWDMDGDWAQVDDDASDVDLFPSFDEFESEGWLLSLHCLNNVFGYFTDDGEDDEQMGGALDVFLVGDYIHMSPIFEQAVPRFMTVGSAFNVQFHHLDNIGDVQAFLVDAVQHVLNNVFAYAQPNDRIGLQIQYVLYCFIFVIC